MIPEIGHFALILALLFAVLQAVLPLWGAASARQPLLAVARPAAHGQCLAILLAYGCLSWSFIDSDFSVSLVALNSHQNTPLIYKITGVWGNHEGSLLLWVMSLSFWTVAVTFFSRRLPQLFVAQVLAVLGIISAGFLAFMLFTSNPFIRLLPAAAQGRDLNPLLQDPGMIIHPPLLYMGYVGFSVAFAFAIAALLSGRMDAAWARWTRPWTTIAWVFLTAGITVGSGWAYYELGWGGWWFWDPVENASFMPWLLGTALIHSLAVTEKRGAFRSWTVLLAIGAFSLSLLGTFLVRSGVITSVHAFATDPSRGIFILVLLGLVIGSSLFLFAWRAPRLQGGGSFALLSRETALLGNNILLAVSAAAVLLGTLYPLILDAFKLGKISVGPPYFEAVFIPLITPVIVLMLIGPLLRWKQHAIRRLFRQIGVPLGGSLLLGVLLAAMLSHITVRTVLGLSLAIWVLFGSILLLRQRWQDTSAGITTTLKKIPSAWWGMWLAHLGLGVFTIGVTLLGSLQSDLDIKMTAGQKADLGGYTFTFKGADVLQGPNYDATVATIEVHRGSDWVTQLAPAKRVYRAQGMPMTEAAIDISPLRDIYVSLGEQITPGVWIVSLRLRPFVSWLWFGCFLMGMGGILAVSDRRYRRTKAVEPQHDIQTV